MQNIMTSVKNDAPFWADITTSTGQTLADLAEKTPVLLVFLRHFGCSFCREAISDISKRKKRLENHGINVVFVHMSPEEKTVELFFKKYKLWPVLNIADPEKKTYALFGLGRGTPQQLFGLMNWIRGAQAAVLEGHGFAYHNVELGDGFQMPGVFVLHKGEIINSFVHEQAWDRPDYDEIVNVCAR
jgi:peroxiredoxin